MTRYSRARSFGVASIAAGIVAAASMFVVAAPAAHAASTNTLNVAAGEYAYKLSGKPQPGWVQFNFDNAASRTT